MRPALLDAASELVRARLTGRARLLVALAGPPGAGKSTLADALAAELTRTLPKSTVDDDAPAAVSVPMDGFHLSNVELARLGLADRKGAPETFDVNGFVHLVRRIAAAAELVYAPAYSREVHESLGGVIPVFPATPVVVFEGNYLLLPRPPWSALRDLFDVTVYLDAPHRERVRGLVRRQLGFGRPADEARDWVRRSDEANARLVETTRGFADVVLSRATSGS